MKPRAKTDHRRDPGRRSQRSLAVAEGSVAGQPTKARVVAGKHGTDKPGELDTRAAEVDRRVAEVDRRERALERREAVLTRREWLGDERDRLADSGTRSQTTANRWQTNERQARTNARPQLLSVSDCSAPKTGWSASTPVVGAKRRTSEVRWPKANVVASMTNPGSLTRT